jgi:WD40 repeat protein
MRPHTLVLTCLLATAPVAVAPGQELRQRAVCLGHTFRVMQAVLSPDGKVLASGGGNSQGGELKLWDAATGRLLATLPGYKDSLEGLVFSPDGRRLASAGSALQVWDVAAGTEVAALKGGNEWGTALTFSQDGARIASGVGPAFLVREIASGKVVASLPRQQFLCGRPAFSPDLGTVAVPNYQEIELWDLATKKHVRFFSEHRGQVSYLASSRDGKTLLAGSHLYEGKKDRYRGEVRLWDVSTGRARAVFSDDLGTIGAAALSSDGKTLAVLDAARPHDAADLKVLDVASGRQRRFPAVPACSFLSVAFTDDGRLFVTGTDDPNTVRLWEVVQPERDAK